MSIVKTAYVTPSDKIKRYSVSHLTKIPLFLPIYYLKLSVELPVSVSYPPHSMRVTAVSLLTLYIAPKPVKQPDASLRSLSPTATSNLLRSFTVTPGRMSLCYHSVTPALGTYGKFAAKTAMGNLRNRTRDAKGTPLAGKNRGPWYTSIGGVIHCARRKARQTAHKRWLTLGGYSVDTSPAACLSHRTPSVLINAFRFVGVSDPGGNRCAERLIPPSVIRGEIHSPLPLIPTHLLGHGPLLKGRLTPLRGSV